MGNSMRIFEVGRSDADSVIKAVLIRPHGPVQKWRCMKRGVAFSASGLLWARAERDGAMTGSGANPK